VSSLVFAIGVALAVHSRPLVADISLPGLTDTAAHPPPTTGPYAYATFVPPGVGSSYVDPIFGATIRRITADGLKDDIYARNMLWNADATKYFHYGKVVDTATGAVTHTIPYGVFSWDTGFDPVDPNVFYYFQGATIHKVVLGPDGTHTDAVWLTAPATIHSVGGSVNWMDGQGRYFIVSYGAEPSVRVFDAQQLDLGPFTGAVPNATDGGYAGITPSGRYVGSYGGTGAFGGAGTGRSYAIDPVARTVVTTGTPFWNLCGDHGVFISPSDGKDYWVGGSCFNIVDVYRVDITNDITGLTEAQQRALSTNMRLLPQQTALFNNHFSAVARGPLRDWAFLDTEYGSNTITLPYQMEIMAINVLTGQVRRLAHHRSKLKTGDYYTQPRVSASWGGEMLAFTSNFQQDGPSDVYTLTFGADVTPPAATVTAPAPGAPITGLVTLSADATDDGGVVGVQFQVNGANVGTEVLAPPYSTEWSSASVGDGPVTITAVVRDAAGNQGTSPPVTVTLANFAPLISWVGAAGLTHTSAMIGWTTSQASDSSVEYGTTTAYGMSTTIDASYVIGHQQAIGDLSPSTLYHYRVTSMNERGQTTSSGDFTFSTAGLAMQGLETSTDGWYIVDGSTIDRRPSLYSNAGGYADGAASSAGGFHARLANLVHCGYTGLETCYGPYTKWSLPNVGDFVTGNGSTSITSASAMLTSGMVGMAVVGPNIPPATTIAGIVDAHTAILTQAASGDGADLWLDIFPRFSTGFMTQVDIYLDVAWAANNPDRRFDWSSSLRDDLGALLSDYTFNVGTQATNDVNAGSVAGFWIGTSTRATRGGADPLNPCPGPGPDVPGPDTDALGNPCRAPVEVSTSGWYTFRHVFHIDPDTHALSVECSVMPAGGAPVLDQAIYGWQGHATADVIGPRHGWFATEEIPDLPIDHSLLRDFDALQLSPASPGSVLAGTTQTFVLTGLWSGSPIALTPGATPGDVLLTQGSADTGTVWIAPSDTQPGDGSLSFDVIGVSPGSVTLTADVDGLVSNAASFSIRTLLTPTIGITNLPANPRFGGSFVPAYAYPGDGATSVTSSTPGTCVESSGLVSFVGAGICTLTAHAPLTGYYTAVTGAPQSFQIFPLQPTIGITNLPVNAGITLSFVAAYAYAGDGVVSVTSTTITKCAVSGGLVTFLATGTCTLQARATATLNSQAATGALQSFQIVKLTSPVSISNLPASGVYNGTFTPAYAYSGNGTTSTTSSTTATCTVSSGKVKFVAVGTCTLVAAAASTTVYVAATGSPQSFVIGPIVAAVSIKNLPTSAVFGGSFTPIYDYTGTGTPSTISNTPTTCSVAAGKVSYVGAGPCALTAVATATLTSTAATGPVQSFPIAKAVPTVKIAIIPSGAVFGGSFAPTYTSTGNGATSATSSTPATCAVAAGKVTYVGAGTCTLVAHAAATANYAEATGAAQSFSISRASATISIGNIPAGATFGGTFTPTFNYTGDGVPVATSSTSSICKVSAGVVTFVNAGTCTLKASAASTANYNSVTGASQSFSIVR
jgi:hypothetical protein